MQEMQKKVEAEAKKEAEEKERKLAEEKAKRDKIDAAKFEALYQIISGNKLEKLVNYIYNGNFDKSENIDNKFNVKIFNNDECIFGFDDNSNGYLKIYYENVDNEKIELIENNDYYALSFVSKANKDKIVDIKLDLENVTDNYKNRIISLNNN